MRFEVSERGSLRQGIEALLAVGGQRGLPGAALDQLEHAKARDTPLYPASKFARAYCDMQDGKRNLLYLFGLAGLLAPVEREAAPGRHALDVHAIAHVVRAWADCESDIWAGGFVLELNDGSRVYLEDFESDGWGPHSAASVVPMPAGNDLPSLSINHCANLFGWREAPELAEYLRRVGASRPFTTSREE